MNYRDILKQTCVDYMQMNEFLINPLIFKKGKGIYLWDINNKKYIDALSGVFVCIFGHNYKPINQALTKQLNKLVSKDTLNDLEYTKNTSEKWKKIAWGF